MKDKQHVQANPDQLCPSFAKLSLLQTQNDVMIVMYVEGIS